MKPILLLLAAGIALIVTATAWWTIDSMRYGTPLVYSRAFKQVTVIETDPVFGTDVQTTKTIPGPYFGLLDLGFPFGALPISGLGAMLIGASLLVRRRVVRYASATFLALMLILPMDMSATTLTGVPSGQRTVTLNDAVRKNEVKFISNAPLENIEGVAEVVRGTFKVDPANLEQTKGSFVVETRSMKTGVEKRDDHMMGKDWLDAATYPQIKYDVTSLKNVKVISTGGGKTTFTATSVGTFTLHGVTKPLEAEIKLTYVTGSEATKSRAAGDLVMIEATFDVPWPQYGVVGRKSFNDKVSQNIQVKASLYGNTGN